MTWMLPLTTCREVYISCTIMKIVGNDENSWGAPGSETGHERGKWSINITKGERNYFIVWILETLRRWMCWIAVLWAMQCIYLFSYPFLFNVNCHVNCKSFIATECTKLLRLWNVEMVTRFRQFCKYFFRHTFTLRQLENLT